MNNITNFYQQLSVEIDALKFSWPVEIVYNPLRYAWHGFTQYNDLYSHGQKRVVFLGMNPGPWGMENQKLFAYQLNQRNKPR